MRSFHIFNLSLCHFLYLNAFVAYTAYLVRVQPRARPRLVHSPRISVLPNRQIRYSWAEPMLPLCYHFTQAPRMYTLQATRMPCVIISPPALAAWRHLHPSLPRVIKGSVQQHTSPPCP